MPGGSRFALRVSSKMYAEISFWGQDIGLPILSKSFYPHFFKEETKITELFFQKANFMVQVTFGIWGKVFWMVKWWISAVKLAEVLSCQFVSQKTSARVVLWPDSSHELFICNTHPYYHYWSEFSLGSPCLVSFFVSWSTAASSALSERWEQQQLYGMYIDIIHSDSNLCQQPLLLHRTFWHHTDPLPPARGAAFRHRRGGQQHHNCSLPWGCSGTDSNLMVSAWNSCLFGWALELHLDGVTCWKNLSWLWTGLESWVHRDSRARIRRASPISTLVCWSLLSFWGALGELFVWRLMGMKCWVWPWVHGWWGSRVCCRHLRQVWAPRHAL